MTMRTSIVHHHLKGEILRPKYFVEDASGGYSDLRNPVIIVNVLGRRRGKGLEMFFGLSESGTPVRAYLDGSDTFRVDWTNGVVPPWTFQRLKHQMTIEELDIQAPPLSTDAEVETARQELHQLAEADRAARNADPVRISELEAVERRARGTLESLSERYGWPSIQQFGTAAEVDFWLLAQHASLEFQSRLLPSLKAAAEKHEATWRQYAYLYDRVALRLGEKQRWGTQYMCEAGQAVLSPVEDLSALDSRRAEVELDPEVEDIARASDLCRKTVISEDGEESQQK
jgi:hypothetical protein